MAQQIAVIIDNRINKLELMEEIVLRIDPKTQCISFIFGDEALRMINDEMVHPPSHIFIDANLRRASIAGCLKSLRNNPKLDRCCITVFSDTMPMAVADAYCSMGADFAFATPLTLASGVELVQHILPAKREATSKRQQ